MPFEAATINHLVAWLVGYLSYKSPNKQAVRAPKMRMI